MFRPFYLPIIAGLALALSVFGPVVLRIGVHFKSTSPRTLIRWEMLWLAATFCGAVATTWIWAADYVTRTSESAETWTTTCVFLTAWGFVCLAYFCQRAWRRKRPATGLSLFLAFLAIGLQFMLICILAFLALVAFTITGTGGVFGVDATAERIGLGVVMVVHSGAMAYVLRSLRRLTGSSNPGSTSPPSTANA